MAICLARLWELRLSIDVGVVAFISYCLAGGALFASGILFNELLKIEALKLKLFSFSYRYAMLLICASANPKPTISSI